MGNQKVKVFVYKLEARGWVYGSNTSCLCGFGPDTSLHVHLS